MGGSERAPKASQRPLVDRQARRIADARSVTLALALTFLGLATVGAIVIRIVDEHDFPSFGLAFWWALQTVTTVGYGDVVPTTRIGQIIGGVEMVLGISFITFLVAGVTSTVIQRRQAEENEAQGAATDVQAIVDGLAELREAVTEMDKRLARIESHLA